jgi:hypothetical protein
MQKPCPAVPALRTGARVGGSHNSSQSFVKTSRRVSSAQSLPKCLNAPTRYHMSRLTLFESLTVRVKDDAQPPPWPELNLCTLCEAGIDRQREDNRAWYVLPLNDGDGSETTRDDGHENSATHLALCSPVQGVWMENLCKRWHSYAGEMTCSSLCAVRPMRVRGDGLCRSLGQLSCKVWPCNSHNSYRTPIPRIKATLPRAVQKPFRSPETGATSKK